MEYLICLGLVVLPIWLGLRSWSAGKQQAALQEYAWSLQNCECERDGYYLRISFPDMNAFGQFSDEYFSAKARYAVRRLPSGHWEQLLQHEETQSMGSPRETRDVRDAKWEPVPEDFQPRIETAYQRFIHRA